MAYRKLILNLVGIFIFGFCFIYAAYVGLPVDFNADHVNNVQGTEAVSYETLIRMIINPFTPAWFYPAEGRMEYLRPLQFLLMKFYFEKFHYSLVPYHVTAAAGHGILLVIFSIFIYFFSRNILFAWLAALLYTSFPTNFFMMTSVFSMDFQYYVSLLSIASLSLFGFLTFQKVKSKVIFVGSVLTWLITMWLAIKLKSSEKVLPFIMVSFLLLRASFILKRIGWLRTIILVLLLVSATPLVVPLKCFERWTPKQVDVMPSIQTFPTTKKDKTAFSFQWKNIVQRTFFVPGGEFPFTTMRRRQTPKSFTENYGFFLGWVFWLGLPWLLWFMVLHRRKPCSKEVEVREEVRRHCLWLIILWFAATIAGFANGISVYDTRLLNFAYVPSIFLFFSILSIFEKNYFNNVTKRLSFQILLTTFVLYTCLSNFSILGKLISHFGGIQDALVRSEKDIFFAVYHEPPTEKTLYERHGELESRVAVIDWYELPADWLQTAIEKLNREGIIYFYARSADSERLQELRKAGYPVVFWKRYDFLDAKPLFFRIQRKMLQLKTLFRKSKKKKENVILIYQVRNK